MSALISSALQSYGLLAAALLLLFAAGATAMFALEGMNRRSDVTRRLNDSKVRSFVGSNLDRARSLRQWIEQLGRQITREGDEEVSALGLRLHRAGFPQKEAVYWLYGARAMLIVILPVVALAFAGIFGAGLGSLESFLVAAAASGAGFILPSFLLDFRIKALKNEYRVGFPDMLDLLVVCLESGMSFEAGLDRINNEIGSAYPHLKNNITQLLLELRAGKDRSAALFALADRLGLEEAASFANMIVQAEQLGSGIAQTLRVCADDMRDKRLLRAEEYAQALPIMLVVPLGAFIFPAILVVTLLPAGISIYQTFINAPP